MNRIDLNQIHFQLEKEVKMLSKSSFVIYKDAKREDVQQAIEELKEDIAKFVLLLNERQVACCQLESLLESKRNDIKLCQLKSKGIPDDELETFKSDILHLIAKAIMNTYLELLYQNQNRIKHIEDNLVEPW